MRIRRLFFLALLPAWIIVCAAAEPAVVAVENGRFRAELVDPGVPADVRATGCRFLRAGWLQSLRLNGGTRDVFKCRTVHPRLPAFGFAFEFFPVPELAVDAQGYVTRLNFGVGIVRQEPGKRFETAPVELFPWRSSVERTDGGLTLTAVQRSPDYDGYIYELTVKTAIAKDSSTVTFELELRNVGRKRIESELYAHPFFDVPAGFETGWYRVGDSAPASLAGPPAILSGANQLAAGRFSDGCGEITIRTAPAFDRAEFWRNDGDCFALEPFWKVSVAPGERQRWICLLTVLSGPAQFW